MRNLGYKDNTLCETRKIKWKGKSKLYYPKKGFELALKDYDSDGYIDDFFIGQGETLKPKDGKSMVYWLFSVNEDGSIWQCTMDNDEKDCLKTVPSNKYSNGFELFGSKIFYTAINDEGETEMKLTKVVGHIQ